MWKCDSKIGKVGVWKLLGDKCLDLFMLVETRSPNQVLNNNSTQQRNKGTMQKLQSYSELVDRLKNNCEFYEFHGPTDNLLIDQENKEFFDDRGIMFMWSEMEYGHAGTYTSCNGKLENEKLEKKKLAEKNRKKRLAEENRLVEENMGVSHVLPLIILTGVINDFRIILFEVILLQKARYEGKTLFNALYA
ncbi:hypothetical protein GLOIN_2v1764812 [Rhizophagus irregularis DAOM 181602=DAOM 197198]|nr:hypothetical protein GLOIN_2v1764812 [Rhizophagus irregularis DAOM 181602=DAOM 197198]